MANNGEDEDTFRTEVSVSLTKAVAKYSSKLIGEETNLEYLVMNLPEISRAMNTSYKALYQDQ